MNTERIGKAAGVVWKKLHSKGERGITMTELKKTSGFTAEELMAGMGWLAREGKLQFKTQGRKNLILLVEQEIFAFS